MNYQFASQQKKTVSKYSVASVSLLIAVCAGAQDSGPFGASTDKNFDNFFNSPAEDSILISYVVSDGAGYGQVARFEVKPNNEIACASNTIIPNSHNGGFETDANNGGYASYSNIEEGYSYRGISAKDVIRVFGNLYDDLNEDFENYDREGMLWHGEFGELKHSWVIYPGDIHYVGVDNFDDNEYFVVPVDHEKVQNKNYFIYHSKAGRRVNEINQKLYDSGLGWCFLFG